MRYFLAVAEERNFTRAAARCRVAQPSLSKQIKQMEIALGVKLFERQTRRTRLTKAGRVFECEAKQTLEHSRRAVSLVHAIARQGERPLNVGISTLTDVPRLHRIVEQAQRSVTGLSVVTRDAYTPELVLGILRGTLDAAIVDLPVRARGLSILSLGSESVIAAVSEKHLLATRTNLQLADIAASPWVLLSRKIDPGRMAMERSVQTSGIEVPAIQDAGNLIELLDHVALGTYVALVRSSVSRLQRSGVLYKPIADAMQMEYAFLWRTDNRRPRLLSLRDAVYAFCQKRPSQEIVP